MDFTSPNARRLGIRQGGAGSVAWHTGGDAWTGTVLPGTMTETGSAQTQPPTTTANPHTRGTIRPSQW
jgi:hypothetical protein